MRFVASPSSSKRSMPYGRTRRFAPTRITSTRQNPAIRRCNTSIMIVRGPTNHSRGSKGQSPERPTDARRRLIYRPLVGRTRRIYNLQSDLPLNTIRASLQRVTRLVVLQRAFGRLYSFVSDVVLMTYSHSGSAPSWVVSLV